MQIKGLQKLTLLDFPGQTACTVFTGGCNFRCPYCHNASLVISPTEIGNITEEEFFAYLRKRQGILDGVAITGGEPLLQADISEFIKKIRELGFCVKLDTNGSFPDLLESLISDGLVDYVAMDIKNSKEKYGLTVGRPDFDVSPICRSVELLMRGTVGYEFRTTVTEQFHTVEDFEKIGKWLSGCSKYYLQNFVDSGNLIDPSIRGLGKSTMNSMLETVRMYIPSAELRGL